MKFCTVSTSLARRSPACCTEKGRPWPLIAHAGALGLPTRIGLEDTTVSPGGATVDGNAELVRLALQIWTASTAP